MAIGGGVLGNSVAQRCSGLRSRVAPLLLCPPKGPTGTPPRTLWAETRALAEGHVVACRADESNRGLISRR